MVTVPPACVMAGASQMLIPQRNTGCPTTGAPVSSTIFAVTLTPAIVVSPPPYIRAGAHAPPSPALPSPASPAEPSFVALPSEDPSEAASLGAGESPDVIASFAPPSPSLPPLLPPLLPHAA